MHEASPEAQERVPVPRCRLRSRPSRGPRTLRPAPAGQKNCSVKDPTTKVVVEAGRRTAGSGFRIRMRCGYRGSAQWTVCVADPVPVLDSFGIEGDYDEKI
jgi:hypothetical protein